MHRKYFIGVLGLTIACFLLIMIFFSSQKNSKQQQNDREPIRSPFENYVSGVGIVEPQSGNIYIGIPFNRIVKHINVKVNDRVKKGDVLFELDNKDLIANLQVKQKEYEKSLANLQKLEDFPRNEDLIIASQVLTKAQASYNEAKTQYEMIVDLPNKRAISQEEEDRRRYRFQQAEAQLKERQAEFAKIKSGTWKPDITIARQEVEQAQAVMEAVKTDIERTIIKSPIDGTVLQIRIHEGETAGSDPYKTLMIVGNTDELYLRVSIDQLDVPVLCMPPVCSNLAAFAFRQGDHTTEFPLQFVHIEPLMIPKKYFTNTAAEKVDTHVFEVLYRIKKKDPSLMIGEQMDVFIHTEKK